MKDEKKVDLDKFKENIIKVSLSEKIYGGDIGISTTHSKLENSTTVGWHPDCVEYGDWYSTC